MNFTSLPFMEEWQEKKKSTSSLQFSTNNVVDTARLWKVFWLDETKTELSDLHTANSATLPMHTSCVVKQGGGDPSSAGKEAFYWTWLEEESNPGKKNLLAAARRLETVAKVTFQQGNNT